MKQAYVEQYGLLALDAHELAQSLDGGASEIEQLEIATALYNCGRLDHSINYASNLANSSRDYGVKFRANLLLAQIHFFKRELDNGTNYVSQATGILSDPKLNVADAEKRLLLAQAHLMCGRMHIAMGRAKESAGCQQRAWEALSGLPETNRVIQMISTLEDLARAANAEGESRLEGSFEEFSKRVSTPPPAPSADPAA
jgi:tetratricopeptide (TPR) repeat protein